MSLRYLYTGKLAWGGHIHQDVRLRAEKAITIKMLLDTGIFWVHFVV